MAQENLAPSVLSTLASQNVVHRPRASASPSLLEIIKSEAPPAHHPDPGHFDEISSESYSHQSLRNLIIEE